jgi:hypothetical protein
VRPLNRNSDARGQVLFVAVAAPIRSPLHLPGRHPTRVPPPPRLQRPRPPRPRHQRAIICMWYSPVYAPIIAYAPSQRYNCGGDVNSSDSTFDLFSNYTVCGAPAVNAGGC